MTESAALQAVRDEGRRCEVRPGGLCRVDADCETASCADVDSPCGGGCGQAVSRLEPLSPPHPCLHTPSNPSAWGCEGKPNPCKLYSPCTFRPACREGACVMVAREETVD